MIRVTLSVKTSQALDQRNRFPKRNLDIQRDILLHRPKTAFTCAANETKQMPSPAADPRRQICLDSNKPNGTANLCQNPGQAYFTSGTLLSRCLAKQKAH